MRMATPASQRRHRSLAAPPTEERSRLGDIDIKGDPA
jgi:hypothetical protein